MDCDTFENHVMDVLYDEGDEGTRTAARKHTEGCTRCNALLTSLRSTRAAITLPFEEPSPDLEERIMSAVRAAEPPVPFHKRLLRVLSWAGSHAMRPQFAMAAVLVVILGSSLLLLPAKPGSGGAVPVSVSERGIPATDEPEPTAAMEAPAAVAAQAAAPTAEPAKTEVDAAAMALAEARATRERSGCAAAAPELDDVAKRYGSSTDGATAKWEAAECYRKAGNASRARELYAELEGSAAYGSRASAAMSDVGADAAADAPAGGAAAAAALPAAAARPAAAKSRSKDKESAYADPMDYDRSPPKPSPAPPAPKNNPSDQNAAGF